MAFLTLALPRSVFIAWLTTSGVAKARMPTSVALCENTPAAALGPGEVSYLIAGIKEVGEARSGETIAALTEVMKMIDL